MINPSLEKIFATIQDELLFMLENTKVQPTNDNPFIIENELGKFYYKGNGRLDVVPIKTVEYVVLNISILPEKD